MKNLFILFMIITATASECFSQIVSTGQTIIAAEYFTNTDPGQGNGTAISATYGSTTATVSFAVSIPQGFILYFRFKSSDGMWSGAQPVLSGASPSSGATLVAGEYFVNTDPGIGKGTSISVGSDGQITMSPLPLSRGDTLYLRAKDSFGRWSSAKAIKYNFYNIVNAQYYIKFANGTKTPMAEMSLTDSSSNYPFFVATSSSIPALTKNDTVYVQVQSDNSFWSPWSWTLGIITAIQVENDIIPKVFKLYQAYPNPFNPSTTIMYDIPNKSHVVIIVYDVLGRNIRTIVDEDKTPGNYRITFGASDLTSGVYFYRLQAGYYSATKKLLLLK